MPERPENQPSSDNSKAPRIVPADHANIIAENLRRIDAALPLFPLKSSDDTLAHRHGEGESAPGRPHQSPARSPNDSGGR